MKAESVYSSAIIFSSSKASVASSPSSASDYVLLPAADPMCPRVELPKHQMDSLRTPASSSARAVSFDLGVLGDDGDSSPRRRRFARRSDTGLSMMRAARRMSVNSGNVVLKAARRLSVAVLRNIGVSVQFF